MATSGLYRDEVEITVEAGKGGDGAVSFHREKFVPRGGPDGGDGGRGGNVVLVASEHVNSLLEIGRQRRYRAGDGRPGGPRKRAGRDGEDRELEVPVGTQVFDARHGNLLRDLVERGQRLVVAAGGAGGLGNPHFATAVRQAPRRATRGGPGEARALRLELKLVAEVGLVGLPNAGKSTLLARISAATPKIADYPFTTLAPEVGIARVGDFDALVVADLPGLIEGAAEGAGLGQRFLKHVERCRVLVQLVDVSASAPMDPVEAWRIVDRELAKSSPALHAKPRLVAATKCEDETAERRAADLEAALAGTPGRGDVLRISSHTGRGLSELLARARSVARGP